MTEQTSSAPLHDDDRWRIALAKDRRFDGVFVTGVHSTGIYCRPSLPGAARQSGRMCASTLPLTMREAAGLRACKRCAPDQQSREEAAVLRVLEIVREADGPVSLDEAWRGDRLFAHASPTRLHPRGRPVARRLCPRLARGAGARRRWRTGASVTRCDLRRGLFSALAASTTI